MNVLTPRMAVAQTLPSADCSEFPQDSNGRHVIDGEVNPSWSQFSNLTFDAECTVRNFTASNPLQANFQFNAPGGGNLLIIFENVVHDGNISCNQNNTHQHQIWYVNSLSRNVNPNCRDLFIPVEKIDKVSPSPSATIGVPFTYTMTIPVLFAPGGDEAGEVIDEFGSPNELHSITIQDDLNATGADLSLVDQEVYWRVSGDPLVEGVDYSFTNVNGLLTWEFGDFGFVLPPDTQFVIELTVVLDDTPANLPGTVFVNTAEWDFGRLIDTTFFEPLPGESGVAEPMTIAAPNFIVTKTGPDALGRTLNLGEWGEFTIDLYNTDGADDTAVTDAWDVTILDLLPNSPDGGGQGGMCVLTPEILSAQVFESNGTTPVPGKGPLVEGTDFSVNYIGAPTCELTLSMLTPAAVVGPGERLIVTYRTKLDPDTEEGVSLTNVVGATGWFNDASTNPERVGYTRTLSDGTPGTPDHEDAHTISTDLYGYFFEKSVANLTSGADPATIAAPGSTLLYTLRLQSTEVPLTDLSFRDDLGSMNPTAVFVPGSLNVIAASLPVGAIDASDPDGGTNGAGLIDIQNLNLDVFSELSIQFEITLESNIPNGTVVTNQADLWDASQQLADSDDPNIDGQADPDVGGDEDPTVITIASTPVFEVEKISDDIDGDPTLLFPGERLSYTITIRNVGTSDALEAVLTDPIPANTTYVPGTTTLNGAAVPDGAGGAPPFASGLLLSTPLDPTPGFMPADATAGVTDNVATLVFEVRVDAGTPDGTILENQAFVSSPDFGIVNAPSDDPATPALGDPTRDIVGDVPFLFATKFAALEVDNGQSGVVEPGDVLRYTITIENNGGTPATAVVLSDAVPANTTYVADSLTLNGEPVGQPDGGISPLIAGIDVSSSDLTPPVPGPGSGTISAGEAAVVEFLLSVDAGTAPGTLIVNQATVATTELEDLPTDGDGNPATGPEPTVVVVGDVPIAPAFDVDKVSADLDGDPSLLLAGERLRYTITVQNVGTADAIDAELRDLIPANTDYVPGSTTLNGTPVADGPGNTPPFTNGLALSSPADPTPGFLPAAVLPGVSNVATVVFEVTVDDQAPDGTIISNQGFVTSLDAGIVDQPSDDPATPAVDDPTRDVVGSVPLLYAEKSAALENDLGTTGIVDPGDTLRYTIRIDNNGSIPVTGAMLSDAVPNNTTYVADSLTLNGEPVGQPDGGVSPLVAGIGVSSTDLTPPLPGPAGGTISPGQSAVVEFVLTVNAGTQPGTLIVNQATVASTELEDLPTDGDGNPATGPEPTVVVVGEVQQLAIAKQVAVVGGGQPVAGSTLEYVVTIQNVGSLPAENVVITDDLDLPIPGQLTFVAGSATMNGVANGISIAGTLLTADYSSVYGALQSGDAITLRFRAVLDANLVAGTLVINTAEVSWNDPAQTETASVSITVSDLPAALDVDKVSSYIDGDPTQLLAGERLRYTITVVNTSLADVTDAVLRDEVPVNTAYVAGSTTLNGAAVADPGSGISPLSAGIAINAPSDPTPGSLPSDPLGSPDNTATIVFDVLVDPDVIDGTVIANQAFVSALASGIADLPSDDPRTPVVDDPTRDVVGNVPLLYAEKSVALEVDLTTPGVIDPGDTLRYTITVHNNGATPATEVVVTDAVPTNTSYVADSMTLNGNDVAPDGGTSPLIAGLPVSTSDLTPPLPGAGEGTLTPGETAVIQFDVVVDAVPPGTLISNQASVGSLELPDLPTDGDGNPATGPEPTVVVVGDVQQLSITKQVAVVGGGPALAGSTLEYTVRVLNLASVPATNVELTDDLDLPDAGQLAYVAGSATLDGTAAGVTITGSVIAADYGAEYGPLQPGAEAVLRFEAVLDAALADGTIVTNIADVSWNDPPQTASASVSVTIGGTPGSAAINGSVWHDANFDDQFDSAELALDGWIVELYQSSILIHTTTTDAGGDYRIVGLIPTVGVADQYGIRFRAPGSGSSTASLGRSTSAFTNGLQTINGISIESGSNLLDLDLPIDPNGVVYNTASRTPLSGAVLTMLNMSTGAPVPATCFEDQAQQGQVTLAYGYYKFDMLFTDGACPAGGAYLIEVTPPSAAYISGPSAIIPPVSGAQTAPLSVPGCLQGGAADAISATLDYCEATISEFSPPPTTPSGSAATAYYLQLSLNDSASPGSAQIFNNHIPVDPDLSNSVSITKTSPLLSVSRGELVPYVITVTNDVGFDLTEVNVVDRFPVGFRYVTGSARIDGLPMEPVVIGQELVWSDLGIVGAGQHRIDLLLAVGAGVSEGDFVNRAEVVHGVTGQFLSNEATATVRLVPDPDFDCTDVMGKVYDDANRNGQQDAGEPGLPGVRLVSTTGLAATTDSYGRYHITCAVVPNESRGSNFVLKLDDRTLPSGFRASLQPIQIARATRGKALRMNFGASIHRVIGLELQDPVFVPDGTELRSQWQSRIVLLLDQLQAAPAVLRLTYLADVESPKLVEDRLQAFEEEIETRWQEQGAYELEIESQIFWRLGGPPELPDFDAGEAE